MSAPTEGRSRRRLRSIDGNETVSFSSDGEADGETNVIRKRFFIAPYDKRYIWWQTFLVLLLVFSAWLGYTYPMYRSIFTLTIFIIGLTTLIFLGSIRTFAKVTKKLVDHVAAGLCCIQLFTNSASQEEALKHLQLAKKHFDEELLERAAKGTRVETAPDELSEETLFEFIERVTIQMDVVRSFDDSEGPHATRSLFGDSNDPETFRRRCEVAETLAERDFGLSFQIIYGFDLPAVEIYAAVATSLAERKKAPQLTEFFGNTKGTIDDEDWDQILATAINVYANKHKELPDRLIEMRDEIEGEMLP